MILKPEEKQRGLHSRKQGAAMGKRVEKLMPGDVGKCLDAL
jgi:hypothetical protein